MKNFFVTIFKILKLLYKFLPFEFLTQQICNLREKTHKIVICIILNEYDIENVRNREIIVVNKLRKKKS